MLAALSFKSEPCAFNFCTVEVLKKQTLTKIKTGMILYVFMDVLE